VSSPYGFLPVTEEILAEIVRRIVTQYDPERIILFGSYAYGHPGEDSDVDLLVVLDSPESEQERYLGICRLLRPRPFPVDIFVKTKAEVDAALRRRNYFYQDIVEKGRTLYERSN
jgi:predicted nucleotidyltransferase